MVYNSHTRGSLCVAPRAGSAATNPCGPQNAPWRHSRDAASVLDRLALRCFLGEWLRHAPRKAPCQPGASPLSVLARAHPRTASSRLASGALRRSRCSREIIHGLLDDSTVVGSGVNPSISVYDMGYDRGGRLTTKTETWASEVHPEAPTGWRGVRFERRYDSLTGGLEYEHQDQQVWSGRTRE